MPYKYLTAQDPIAYTPKEEYTNQFQQTVYEQFYNASDIYTIQEETSFASGEYQNVDVRLNNVFNPTTADKIEDDFKKILFREIDHSVSLGRLYKFDSNYWVAINVDKIKTLAQTAIVKRCNNMLRWQTPDGGIHEAPCSLDYLIKENRDYSTAGSAIVVPSGMIGSIVQFNSVTNLIRPNQRFLFGNSGNWTAYRVEGGGINNFDNRETINNLSGGIIKFTLALDYISDGDDLVNGIANVAENVYTLTLNQSVISGDSAQTVQLIGTVTLNDKTVSRTLVWSSSNTLIATVNSSGLVTFVNEGTAVITCSLLNNDGIYDSCDVEVTSSPVDNYQVVVTPNVNFVLEGEEVTWSVYLYLNGVQEEDTFDFVLDANSVPNSKYIYQVMGSNTFKVHNYGMFLTDVLEITATSGIYSKVITVLLKGVY